MNSKSTSLAICSFLLYVSTVPAIPLPSIDRETSPALLLAIGSYTNQPWVPNSAGPGVAFVSLTDGTSDAGTSGSPAYTNMAIQKIIPPSIAGENPSYCSEGSQNASTLYCSNSNTPGSVTSISTTKNTSRSVSTGRKGGSPSYIATLSGGAVVTANYGGGSVTSFTKNASGSLELADEFIAPPLKAAGDFPHNAPHIHMALEISDGVVIALDLGSDIVWELSVAKDGTLEEVGRVEMSKGDGPRHAALDENSGTVYIVAELSLTLIEMRKGCSTGDGDAFEVCGRTALLPGTGGFSDFGKATAAAIRISEDGRFVYASVRSQEEKEGVIVGFEISGGKVGRRVGAWGSGGLLPWDFALVEGPKCKAARDGLVVITNRDSDNVVAFRRSAETGEMMEKVAEVEVKTACSVLVLQN